MQGYNSEDIALGIDEHMIRQPLGVVAAITPFNFPAMIPFWFMPYALATGNCFILKPSERVPLTSNKLFHLLEAAGFPPGVVQLVNGGKETVNALLDHPAIRAISFVGSTATARYIYGRAAANGKRAQCQGGAKNPVVVMPDADMEMTTKILADSAFGCAGQRCLAASVAITVGEAKKALTEQLVDAASSRKVGYGLDQGVEMGPVISAESKARIEALIARGEHEGASLLVDGRGKKVKNYEDGFFVFPTILEEVPPQGEIARTEIFGPVLSLMHATFARRGDPDGQCPQLRQHGLHLHQRRRQCAAFPLRGQRRQRGHQRRRGGAYRIFPLQRVGRELLWRPARPGAPRCGVLHPDQGGDRTLAAAVEPEVLAGRLRNHVACHSERSEESRSESSLDRPERDSSLRSE